MPGIDSYTKLMLHCNGTDGSTTFIDDSGTSKSPSAIGTAQIDQAQFKFGNASGLMDGNSDYVSIPDSPDWDLGTGDFTIDFWVRFNTVTNTTCFCGRYTGATSYFYFGRDSSTLRFRDYNNANIINIQASWTPSTGQWYHIAAVRESGVIKLYVNGTSLTLDSNIGPSNSFTDRSNVLEVGANSGIGYWLNGWIDEFRWDKGIARWSTDFTPPTEEYSSASNVTVSPTTLSAIASIQSPLAVIPLTVPVSLLDLSSTLQTPNYIGAIQLVQPLVLETTASIEQPNYTITSTISPAYLGVTASVNQPSLPGLKTVRNAKRIISFNPLIIVMDTDPLKLAKVDITIPSAPTHEVYSFTGVSNAQDIIYSSIFDKLYVTCADGKILEINASDFATYTVYDSSDTNNLTKIALLDGFKKIYTASDDISGEVIVMDDSISQIVMTDIRWAQVVSKLLRTQVDTTHAKELLTDIRWASIISNIIGTDIRFNEIGPEEPEDPISRLDFHVYLDNVELTDVKMDSIIISHVESEKSRAQFILSRQHDNLDYTLEGVYSQITNNNIVRVEIDGHIEFEGRIWNIDTSSEQETVQITAYSEEERSNERSLVTLSLPSLNERLRLHHALINNPRIEKPFIAADDMNPAYYKGILVNAGFKETQNISQWSSLMDSAKVANDVINGEFIPMQNWTYFWFATAENYITGVSWATLNYIGTSPGVLTGDTWAITGLAYKYQRKFESKVERLGTGIVYANHFKDINTPDAIAMYNLLKPHGYITYNGITIEDYKDKPSVYAIMEDNIGYMIGEAPFKKVSAKSGCLITKNQWIDEPDGLYRHKDEGYDYREYAKKVAELEYKKIQNINGQILPKTSANIDIFIDAYYYYNIQLLKRINIDNTIRPNIYNNQNGFPLSVKGIDISSATMKVSLRCDNDWSRTEMLEIEASYPNPDEYVVAEEHVLNYRKFDPRLMDEVE